jgi:O-antigen/teichoic acid export membrane protein
LIQDSYTKNYIKIYFWRGISVILNLLALFIVIPRLSSSPTIYGIYSVCISVAIYLSYADIGFLKAGVKYATEFFAQGNRKKEQEYIGFSLFVLALFVLIIAAVFLSLSFSPDSLIKGLKPGNEWDIASKLLKIQALFSLNVILQRFVDSVFAIRLETYISQRIRIVASLLKIVSVFYFFPEHNYNIVGYFFFIQLLDFLGHLGSIWIISRRYQYDLLFQVKSFRYKKSIFSHVKGLALGSFYITITWLLYYELDQIVIGKMLGAEAVAIYALGFTLLTYYRTLSGIIFSPFQARFNHFVGLGKVDELRGFYLNIIKTTMPVVVFTVVPIIVLAEPFILSWVGNQYQSSVLITKFLIASNLFLFINIPGSYIIMSFERIRELYLINTLIAVVFWLGIFLLFGTLGTLSFAVFKLVAAIIAMLFYLKVALDFMKINLFNFCKETVFKLVVPVALQILFLSLIKSEFTIDKSTGDLLLVLFIAASSIALSFVVYALFAREFREKAGTLIEIIKGRIV